MKEESILELNEIRERFVRETERACPGIFRKKKKTVKEYCGFLYEFIVRSRIQEKLYEQEEVFCRKGDRAMEKEYAQIYGIVMELLDKMTEIWGRKQYPRRNSGRFWKRNEPGKSSFDSSGTGSGSCGRYGENPSEGCSRLIFCRRE